MAEWHPIRVVARRTGLSAHVIRAWEKRYGAVTPSRTPTNRRVYSNEDVERLVLLRRATLLGRSIGQIASLSVPELERLVADDEKATSARPGSDSEVGKPGVSSLASDNGVHLDRALRAVRSFDTETLERALDEASVAMSRPALMTSVIVPLMHEIGDEWKEGTVRIAHEHLATAVVRSFLGSFNGAFPVPRHAPGIVVTTPSGHLHEIGALLAAASAASEGWRAIYLGPSLPADEIAAAVQQTEARAVALSLVYPNDDPHARSELQRLVHLLAPRVPVLVGGRSAAGYRNSVDAPGIQYLESMKELRRALESLLGERA